MDALSYWQQILKSLQYFEFPIIRAITDDYQKQKWKVNDKVISIVDLPFI